MLSNVFRSSMTQCTNMLTKKKALKVKKKKIDCYESCVCRNSTLIFTFIVYKN